MNEKEVLINFESEKREGIVAVDTYLIDAAKRLGIYIECDCNDLEVETKGSCAVTVSKGADLLSAPTALELELLSDAERKKGERLACQTKIENPGEITIMAVKNKESDAKEEAKDVEEETREEFKKQFEDLPLEKKISNLLELEAIALSETFSFVVNSPYAAVGKVMEVMAGFGLKMEREEKEAKRPDEHAAGDAEFVDYAEDEKSADKEKTSTTAKKKNASKSSDDAKKPTVKKTNSKKEEDKKDKVKAEDKKDSK